MVNTFCSYIAGVFISLSALIMFYDVLGRYIFNSPSLFAPFVVAFLTLAALFFGIGYSLQAGGQVHIETLVDKLPPMGKKICLSIGYCFTLIFAAILLRQCFIITGRAIDLKWLTVGNVLMPMFILYAIMTLGYFLLIVAVISKFIQLWAKKKDDPKEVGK